MDYTTTAEVLKRYAWLTEDGFDGDRIEVAIYDASRYIDSKLGGIIPILPFTLESQLTDYPIIETLCVQLAVCFFMREQNVRVNEERTKELSYAFESATCGAAESLIADIQKGNATIGEVIDDSGEEVESRSQFLVNTGRDVFNLF